MNKSSKMSGGRTVIDVAVKLCISFKKCGYKKPRVKIIRMNPRSQVVAAATTASAVRGKGSSSTLQTEWGPSKTEVGRGRSVCGHHSRRASLFLITQNRREEDEGRNGGEGGGQGDNFL